VNACHRPLHRPQADCHAKLALQILAHHIGVAAVLPEPLRNPALEAGQRSIPSRPAVRHPALRLEVALHRVGTKLFVRRNERGTSFKEVVDAGRSLPADRRQHAKTVAKPGFGDRGDQACGR
jgi:hypothetical protein